MPTLIWIASALAAGVLARFVMKSRGFGFVGDASLGVLGSVSGAWLLRLVGGEVSPGGIAHIATAFVGAICLVAVGRLALRVAQGASQLSEATVGATLPDIETQIRRLSDLERKVLSRVLRKQGLPPDPSAFRQHLSLGDRVADRVAIFGGSWTFLGCFAAFMLAWMFLNTATARPADPYPFILLNLILSCLAAVQAPIIMMSQNRQAARDRFDAQQDYQVNVRAEMQISELHVKLDEARNTDWQAVIALERQQLEVLQRIEKALNDKGLG
jgi:uncharacterized membrane protein/uncharacterized membrane protein YeaQ/YmgE (transglycosylase-associated protein family)